MGATKVLAKGWIFEIDTDPLATTPTGTPVWTRIKGVNTFSVEDSKTDANTSDFDSDADEHIPVRRGKQVTLEGYYLEDVSNGDRDPGQEAVEEYGRMVGLDALATFRMTSPGGKVFQFKASVNMGSPGGGNDDPTNWSATLTRSGETTINPT